MLIKRYKIKRVFKKIIAGAVIIGLLYLGINLFNNIFKDIQKEKTQPTLREQRIEKYNEAMLGTKEIPEKDVPKIIEVIDTYYNYCNDKNYEQAYSMLDDMCKKADYPTLDEFKVRVDESFDKLKLYRYKNVTNLENQYLYKVTLYDDVMAYGLSEFPTETEYYIVINDKGEGKYTVSLNGLLERKELNYKITNENVQLVLNFKEKYYTKTKINYTITNNSDKVVALNTTDIRLISKQGNAEKEYRNGFGDNIIHILPGVTKSYISDFKISNIYDYIDDRIEFSTLYTVENIINDNEEFEFTTEYVENNYISKFNMQIPL
ncbi:MAG: hypothetical protein E7311_03010 [Clostridiales bacterium]|nr:hypothetical protein [Clostridiales bacterium]